MTKEDFKQMREKHGMSQAQMAQFLRLNSGRAVRAYELGEREISGPITLCLEYLDKYGPLNKIEN